MLGLDIVAARSNSARKIRRAIDSVIEPLESRRLLAGDPAVVQPLPYSLAFTSPVTSVITDANGAGTGFSYVQPNAGGTEYQPGLIAVNNAAGRLNLTTTGTSTAGGPWESDNTLVDGLQTGFDATTNAFTIQTRLIGPLSYLTAPSQQGGILFGPDDDNYVKFVAGSTPNGQVLQFVDEQKPGSSFVHAIATNNSYTNIGSFASISTLDLRMIGDPTTGRISGAYSVNGGAFVGVGQSVTLTGTEKAAFFTATAKAGIMAMAKNALPAVTVSFANFSITKNTTTTTTGTKLTGTLIGTSGSYNNQGNTIAKAVDGNTSTYYDGSTGTGNYVGLNLGAPGTITQVQYAPRSGYEFRMVGGTFQGSSSADFSTGLVNLYTITATPVAGGLTSAAVTNTSKFQYVRYMSPASSFGNVAEVEFDGVAGTVTSTGKLTGNAIGTAGSYGNTGNTVAKVFDGSLSTYFDAPTGNNNWAGLDLSTTYNITKINYAPRVGYEYRMVGGIFQGSNTADFSSGVSNLYTISTAPAAGSLTTVTISNTGAFRYVRYLAPASSYGNVAELEFYGNAATVSTGPRVFSSSPANGATGVARTAFVSCALTLPNGGVYPFSLTDSTVYLYRTFDGAMIPAVVNTDGGGGVIVLQPSSPLDANTSYTFVITNGVKDITGVSLAPYQATFTTNSATIPTNPNIAFSKTDLPTTTGQTYTGLVVGPDGNLYASTLSGDIFQFPISSDGTLGNPTDIKTVITNNGGAATFITGMAFDPASTASNMTLWLSIGSGAYQNAPDFSGKIVMLSGTNFSTYKEAVVGLPRSNSNHLNNQPIFGPDGALYWSQGSNTSMGAPDSVWGYRNEHLLNAAILRLDVAAIKARLAAGQGAVNAQTDNLSAGQTAYNPYAAGAPLTLYATGVRNAYDLVWASNGHLYAPTNGAAATGNIPGTPAGVTPSAPALNNVPQAEDDFLYDIAKGGYYGHPDPARGEYIFDGGNPATPVAGQAVESSYPVGQVPDPNYRGFSYDFGAHYSPDGVIQYVGSAFNGALNGTLLVVRYSGGKDILALTPDVNGSITATSTGITGFTSFNDPVDLIEDKRSGFIYVAELGGAKLTLLKPIAAGATANVSASTLYFNDPTGGSAGPAQPLTITNTGNQPLAIPATGLTITGTDGSLFIIASKPTLPATIAPGQSATVTISYSAGSSSLGIHTAQLQIQSNDPNNPTLTINLRGISTAGLGGNLEPSLQRIFDLYQIPLRTGTADPSQTTFTTPPGSPNDEVTAQAFVKADPESPVTVQTLAAFSASITPSAGFGWYSAGLPSSKATVFTINSADAQSVDVTPVGASTFDPGVNPFGLFVNFDAFLDTPTGNARVAYSEDAFNTWDTTNHRKMRFYPLKNTDGSTVANAYVFTSEDYGVAPSYDSNDVVGIVRNVRIATAGAKLGIQNLFGTSDLSGPSAGNRLEFNAIANPNYPAVHNVVHNTSTARLTNTGSTPLVITAINSTNSAFFVNQSISYPLTINPGSTYDLKVTYNPGHTGINAVDAGTLTITSNDAATPAFNVQLAGFWEAYGNTLPNGTITEPSVNQLVNNIFGYTTVITNAGQSLNTSGAVTAVGEEALSTYWSRADGNLPVTVRQLGSFHTQGNGATIYGYLKGQSKTFTTITSVTGDNGQSILSLTNDAANAASIGFYYPTSVFGLNVDKSEYSDDSLNTRNTGDVGGHHMRFWPARDAAGNVIANTWLMGQDYSGINFDYNDNVYLISNMKPAPPATPANVSASGSTAGITVTWSAVSAPLLAGYYVYRSTSQSSGYVALNSSPTTATSYVDSTATPGTAYFYTVVAVDKFGSLGSFSGYATATRPKNNTAPAAPAGLSAVGSSSANFLSWTPNSEVDLAGYNVFRSTSVNGTYFSLNSTLLTTNSFSDTSATVNQISYYKVYAVNTSGVSSSASSAQATRSTTSTPPSMPVNFTATPTNTGIVLAWAAGAGNPPAGYNLYKSTSASGPFTKLNGALLTTTTFTDTAAVNGGTFYYRVTAVDSLGQESAYASASATAKDVTAPAKPTGFAAASTAGGIQLTWTASTDPDLAGYNVLRSNSATGTFTKINTALITTTSYLDAAAPVGQTSYYQLVAVDTAGNASTPASVPAFRTNTVAPATPANFAGTSVANGVNLTWSANPETDIAGYKVYSSSSPTGPFTLLTITAATALSYTDTTAPAGATTYYQLFAADTSTLVSTTPATTSVARQTVAATPTNFQATVVTAGVSLQWDPNTEVTLLGYNVYRATSATGPFTQLNTSLLTTNTYVDPTAVAGNTYYYQLVAIDSGAAPSVPAMVTIAV